MARDGNAPDPVVLVTGCSSGIGREAVRRLANAGARVVATARDPRDIQDLAADRVTCLTLDVTDTKQRQEVVQTVWDEHGQLDALVNNAGYGVMTAVEDTSVESLKAMFEVNLFGLHGLTREVLPHMRSQGRGRIVNVSSIAGHLAIPLMGGYCATKFALRAMTQALHNEVRPFGIHASLIEPGIIRTGFGDRSRRELEAVLPHPEASPYAPLYARWLRMRDRRGGADPATVARSIVHACLDQRPRLHYFAPFHSKAAHVAGRLAPDAMLNVGYRAWFGR